MVLAIVLLLFGADRLPKLARSLGSAVREFREGQTVNGDEAEHDRAGDRARSPTAP